MDRGQIRLKLGLKVLGIQVTREDYNEKYRMICNIAYIAKTRGMNVFPGMIEFNPQTGQAYSPLSHEYSGCPSWNLYRDLEAVASGSEAEIKTWRFDEVFMEKLIRLREDISARGIDALLKEASKISKQE
ncbi:MAG: hypothetical protein Q8L29_02525 [archaeon]|nr:hypothetical protein [archaeon]